MEYPTNLKYTKEHEWIRIEGDRAVMGITDHAQSELGDVVYVELPQKSRKVKQGEAFAVVESVKAVSDVYAPVDGEVTEANAALGDQPELVNESPYDKGWIAALKLSDASQLKNLLDAEAYKAFVGSLS
ncbi:MAG TPA: glycine cleavage system protein GcvH [Candidatus Bipolaricaulota bacterium]